MLYPSKYVLVTDIDLEKTRKDKCTSSENNVNINASNKKFSSSERKVNIKIGELSNGVQKFAANMPERVWQDMVMNPAYTGDKSEKTMMRIKRNETNLENFIANTENSASSCQGGLWNFTEPCLKTSCSCKRLVPFNSLIIQEFLFLPICNIFC